MRIDYGSGYRVSYTIRRRVVVILLAGGTKKTQTRDIKRGHEMLAGLDEWRKKENPLLAGFSRAARRLWPVYAVPPDFFLSQTKMTDSIVLFESQDHEVRLDVGLAGDTVWLNKEQLGLLFGRNRTVITRHIANLYREGELEREGTCAKFAQVRTEGGRDVGLREQTVWLSQEQMATLFGRSVSAISRHISNAIKEGEIDEESNLQKVQIAGSDRPAAFYDLDVIISVGYRVKSRRGVESQ